MIELSLFRRFIPTHVLAPAERAELARHCHLGTFQPGATPFRRNSASNVAVYLVEGEVELADEHGRRRVRAGSEEARHALSNAERFTVTATCVDACQLLFVDRARLDFVLTWTQTGAIEVNDIQGDDQDWMGCMLQCPAMQLIPPANIARVLARVVPVAVAAGDTIIEQGEQGDAYYVLTAGRCEVRRAEATGQPAERIDTLGPGAGFGEEALLSGEARNATVRALEDSRLVRLDAADFAALLKAPLLREVVLERAPPQALRIDVRLPEEFAHGHLPGALNVPLRALRERCAGLDRTRPLVVYCDGGRRSAAATFLFCERGFDASWVAGGVPAERLVATDAAAPPSITGTATATS
jgi:rhodanese-related sulfurtransferase